MFHYIFLGFCIALPIGAISIEMTKQGFQNGFLHAWMVGIGAITVDITLLIALNLGLVNFLNDYKSYLWLLGALFLAHLGWQSLKEQSHSLAELNSKKESLFKIFKRGLMIGLNPGNIVFWLSVLGTSIVGASDNSEISLMLISISILLGIILHDVILAYITSFFNRFMTPKAHRVVSIVAGISLFGFSAHFATEWFASAEVFQTLKHALK